MELTQECKDNFVAYFACSINLLSDKYIFALERGDNCAENYLFVLSIVVALNEILCSINVEEETCLTEEQICVLIDNIKELLKSKNCGC